MMGSPARPRAEAPPDAAKKPSPVVPPPAAARPAMTLPTSTRPVEAPAKPAKPAAGDRRAPRRRPPAAPAAGAARRRRARSRIAAWDSAASRRAAAWASGSYLDVKNFCCPDYLVTMLQLIQGNWNARQQVAGEAMVVFRIQRDGRLTDIELERSSGYPALDLTAQRALFLTQRVPPLPSGLSRRSPDGAPAIRVQTVTMRTKRLVSVRGRRPGGRRRAAGAARGAGVRRRPQSQQQSEVILSISGETGRAAALCRAGFHRAGGRRRDAGGGEADGRGALGRPRLRARVLHGAARHLPDDPRRRGRLPRSPSTGGANWASTGSSRAASSGPAPGTFRVEVRLFDVRTRRSVMAKEYTGSTSNPRLYAHTAADDIHLQQRALRGAARSKLTFSSDRDGERVANAIAERDVKEIYISDYDGANQRRVTVTRKLNIFPRWAPDARAIAYTSYRRGLPRHLHLAHLPGHAREPDRRGAARTGCRPGRPTARASASRRRATGTPSST